MTLKKLVTRLLLTVVLGTILAANSRAASVGAAGYTNDFGTWPAVADWSTLSVTGAVADVTTTVQMDAAVALLTASSINLQVVSNSANPPGALANATWSSSGQYVQTRSTGVKLTLLMATLVNNTGSPTNAITISYDFAAIAPVTEQILGQRVYYSLTGLTNSWVNIPALSSPAVGGQLTSIQLASSWANAANLYLLWVDDNGSGSPDTANQIDNFFIRAGALPPTITVTSPTNGQTFSQGNNVTVTANGTGLITNVNLYLDNVLLLNRASVPLTTNLTTCDMTPGTHTVYAQVTALGATATSVTNAFTITANTAPTIVLSNTGPSTVPVGTLVTLNANVTDNASLAAVDFYQDGTKVYTRTAAPWSFASSGTPPGVHSSYAVVTDACGLSATSAPIVMTIAGSVIYSNNFSVLPPVNHWSCFSSNGNGDSFTTAAGLDAIMTNLPASVITNLVVSDTNNPPALSASAVWSSTGGYVQTRPTGNGFTALMASLTNNTGADIFSFVIGYAFAQPGVVDEQVDGHRVYFSLTGAAGSWTNMPGLSSVAPGLQATNINATWRSNSILYVLWLDDNGSGSDSPNQIDNFFLAGGVPPAIVTQPENILVCPGSPAPFTVGVSGSLPLSYQWRKVTPTSTNNIIGATNQSYTVSSAGSGDVARYGVVVTNSFGSVTSTVATLTLSTNRVAIVAQPQSLVQEHGTMASFAASIDPNSAEPLFFQWGRVTTSGTEFLSGATQPVLTVGVYETNVADYFVIVSNCINAVTSQLASLSLYYIPLEITNQPVSVQMVLGGSACLSVGIEGSRPAYQWFKGSTPIAGATNATLCFSNLIPTDSGVYHVEANNPYPSSVVSATATLVVLIPPYELMPLTNTWKYNQTGTDLGFEWRAVGYNDTSWPSGQGVLAKEDNAAIVPLIRTTLSLTNASGGTNRTFYFRTTFNLTNDLRLVKVLTSNLVDDAHVVYVNGVEAYRSPNMPAGNITYATFALAAHAENAWEVAEIPPSLLVQGTNTVAVEVHQSSAGSTDAVWGMTAQVTFPPPTIPPAITNQPLDLIAVETKPATFSVGYIGDAVLLQWYKQHTNDAGADPVPGGVWSSLTITNPILGVDDGYYFVVISNLLGTETSRAALLTLLPDTNGPALLYADGTGAGNIITLTFNERMMVYDTNNPTGSPTNPANYTVTNTFGASLPVLSVKFQTGSTNDTNIVLTTSGVRVSDANYIVTVKSLRDTAPRHNLSTNLASPVSTLLRLVNWDSRWAWSQPDSFYQPGYEVDFTNGAWKNPDYVLNTESGLWALDALSIFVAYGYDYDWPGAPSHTGISSGWEWSKAYFRVKFNYNASPAGASVSLSRFVDDGDVLYLNGSELTRFNMPTGAVMPDTLALTRYLEPRLLGPSNISTASLVLGTNLIAAEAHQQSTTADPSLTFGLELSARIDSLVTGKVYIITGPADLIVSQSDTANFGFRGVAGSSFQWFSNSVVIPGATNPTYQIASTPLSANGSRYSIAVANYTGSVTSSPALLTVLPDTNAPILISAYLTDSNKITVTFSESVTALTATNLINYFITNALGGTIAVTSIAQTSGSNVVLTVSAFPPGFYTMFVSNIKDATVGNTIVSNSPVTLGVQNYALVADGSTTWRYNQDNQDLGTAWRAAGYNDSSWSNGVALFDRDTGGVRATVSGVAVNTRLNLTNATSGGRNIPTYYFRTRFVPPLLGSEATMTLRPILDDGAAFYLNEQLAYSIRVTTPTAFANYALAPAVGDAAYEGPFNVSTASLLAGTNMFAVEVKNINATSSDITFGAWLYLNVPSVVLNPLPPPVIVSGPSVAPSNNVATGASFLLSVAATGDGPLKYQWRKGGVPLLNRTNATAFFSNVTTNDTGSYDVVVSNPGGGTLSGSVTVTVRSLDVPPSPPQMFITLTNGNQVHISWSSPATFNLESTNRLTSSHANWTYVTNQSPYVAPATNAALFYQLRY